MGRHRVGICKRQMIQGSAKEDSKDNYELQLVRRKDYYFHSSVHDRRSEAHLPLTVHSTLAVSHYVTNTGIPFIA